MGSSDREKTAAHEAGHGVANVLLICEPIRVSIAPGAGLAGCTTTFHAVFGFEDDGRRARSIRAGRAIVTLFAGLAAEHVLSGTPFVFEGAHAARHDHSEAVALMDHVRLRRGDLVAAYLLRRQTEALALVRRWSWPIRHVALALLDRGELTGDQVRRLMFLEALETL